MLLFTYFFIAVGISFLCSILESVLLSITPAYIEVLKEEKPASGKLLEEQKQNIDMSIGAILTLNTFAHTLGAAGVGAEAVKIFGDQYMFYVSAVLTLLILIFSEIIPKTLGAYYWKELAPISARITSGLVFITYPLLKLMQKITALISKNKKATADITKEEIEATVHMGEEAGIIKEQNSHIVRNIFSLNEVKIKDIHTPRKVMFSINKDILLHSLKNNDFSQIDMKRVKEYSRIPIYNKDIDDIEGVIISKEFFDEALNNRLENKEDIIREVYKINENIPVSKLVDMFIIKKEHMFLVVDNYDQTEGLVTLEDALETILGREIVDELDKNIDMRELAKNG
ncbi:MAG: CNNM domain-containing protein [Campylobacterota bacterium]|nr:CNNM domain-containing protein [Campylobacterota bacterium]